MGDLVRIGDKVISLEKLHRSVDEIILLRVRGASQQDVASELRQDRGFISRLESLGEVRKGGKLSVVGFPVANPQELHAVCQKHGAELILLLTETERQNFVHDRTGVELVNDLMSYAAKIRTFDLVVVLASDLRLDIIEAMLGIPIVPFELGKSPLSQDVWVDPMRLDHLLAAIAR